MEVCSIIKKLNLLILISLLLNNKILIESYSQVSRVGATISGTNNSSNNNNTNNSEIIKHHPGREGVFSDNDESNKTLSESNDDELTTIENKPTEVFTGRSSPSTGGFQLPFNFNTKPISYRRPAKSNENSSPASSSPIFVYPSYGSKSIDETYKNSPVPPSAMDRFSPGEAYGFQQQLKKQKNNGYDYTAPKSRLPDKTANAPAATPPSPPSPPINLGPPPSPVRPVYLPPKDLYSFPPNIGANYLPPTMNGNQRPVTSYLPPAAGIPDDFNSNSFVGPVNPKYLPSSNSQDMPQDIVAQDSGSLDADSTPNDNDNHDHDHDHDHNHDHSHDYDHDHDHSHDHHHHEHDHDTPPSAPAPVTESALNQMMALVVDALKNNNNNNNSPPPVASPPSQPTGSDTLFSSLDHDHYHHHDHDYPNQFDPSFPTGSDLTFSDHDHFHDHDFHGQYGIDASPELIYDHDPHDHHHDIIITTTEPPPPPPQEPRVTKYSYYYLGRKLWYVPLYFTVYFTLYVASLIIRSIGRHKVEWPNHYTKRSIDDMSHKETVRKVEKLTNFVMNSMEDFKEKYL